MAGPSNSDDSDDLFKTSVEERTRTTLSLTRDWLLLVEQTNRWWGGAWRN